MCGQRLQLVDATLAGHCRAAAYRDAAGEKLDMEAERRIRSTDEMSAEATQLRQAMADFKH